MLTGCNDKKEEIVIDYQAPEGMVYIPKGKVSIGTEKYYPMEKNGYETTVQAFFMDIHPVTVKQFRAFIEATNYETQAEIFGDAAVLNDTTKLWELRKGAFWEFPQGKNNPKAIDNHPVTQVSWNDVQAYCKWVKRRLPTEIEWEHAAKNAKNIKTLYPWGNDIVENGRYKANFWQGLFPNFNEVKDQYAFSNPVGAFGKTELGLTDMAGNVWEWCEDWYLPYSKRNESFTPNKESEKVQRGGSFLCDQSVCYGFRTTARSHSTPESALFHVGFRTVNDVSSKINENETRF